jgi:hypothetical protein
MSSGVEVRKRVRFAPPRRRYSTKHFRPGSQLPTAGQAFEVPLGTGFFELLDALEADRYLGVEDRIDRERACIRRLGECTLGPEDHVGSWESTSRRTFESTRITPALV